MKKGKCVERKIETLVFPYFFPDLRYPPAINLPVFLSVCFVCFVVCLLIPLFYSRVPSSSIRRGTIARGGPGAMAEMGLDQRTQLAETAMVFHDLEERIVAETAAAAGGEENPAAAGGRTFAADRAAGIGKADMADELGAALSPAARRARPPATSDCCRRPSPRDRCSGRKARPALRPRHRPSGRCRRPGPTGPGAGPAASPSARRWRRTCRRLPPPRWPADNRPACEVPDRRGPAAGQALGPSCGCRCLEPGDEASSWNGFQSRF